MGRTPGARSVETQVKVAAVRLVRSGIAQARVAKAFGVDPSAVSRWWRLARRGGYNALARRPVSGRPPKLSPTEIRRVAQLAALPPSTTGIRGDRWTAARLAELIRRETGIAYHPSHAWRILRRRRTH